MFTTRTTSLCRVYGPNSRSYFLERFIRRRENVAFCKTFRHGRRSKATLTRYFSGFLNSGRSEIDARAYLTIYTDTEKPYAVRVKKEIIVLFVLVT